MQTAYINRVATAVPRYDVHYAFRRFAQSLFHDDRHKSLLFERMTGKSGIDHRYSCLAPSNLPEGGRVDANGFYLRGDFADTAARMRRFEQHAPAMAQPRSIVCSSERSATASSICWLPVAPCVYRNDVMESPKLAE